TLRATSARAAARSPPLAAAMSGRSSAPDTRTNASVANATTPSTRTRFISDLREPSRAVADRRQLQLDLVEQAQPQIHHWRELLRPDVATALQLSAAAANNRNRQIARAVEIA